MLRGRRSECEVFDGLLGAVRDGRSGALVVCGEPGVGKTALLEYAIASASDLTAARAVGWSRRWSCPSRDCINCARRCSMRASGSRSLSARRWGSCLDWRLALRRSVF